MNYIILGSGGIGTYYGAKLQSIGCKVLFIARGKHLETIKKNGLILNHPTFNFKEKVSICTFEDLDSKTIEKYDAILFTTKSLSTKKLAEELSKKVDKSKPYPYLVSLQNGVENEDIINQYFKEEKIIGGLSRKIGAHIVVPGKIDATGDVETIIGALKQTSSNDIFLQNLKNEIIKSNIKCNISNDIRLELWKKLIINNGVNAICALLRIKTGILMSNEKLSQIVYGLMNETAQASKDDNVNITKKDVDQMFELIKHFDSIKPSMLVDVENNRPIELDEICNVVIKKCKKQNIDAAYTKTISTLLEFTYID